MRGCLEGGVCSADARGLTLWRGHRHCEELPPPQQGLEQGRAGLCFRKSCLAPVWRVARRGRGPGGGGVGAMALEGEAFLGYA